MDTYRSLKTLIYSDNKLKYKKQNELKLYKEKQIESTFLEVAEPFGGIYKHSDVPITEFTNDYMGPLL